MKLSVERKPESIAVLNITADDEEFERGYKQAFNKASKTIQIPGFRKGKAPKALIEKYYGREYFLREAADTIMDTLYRDALKQEDLSPVGEPEVEIVDLEPVNFIVTVPVYPTVTLGDYTTVRTEPIDATTTEEEVDEVIGRLQRNQSPWVEVTEARTPAEGEQVTVDYTVFEGDEVFQAPITDAQFVIGETNLLTQLSTKLQEMTPGESSSFELLFEEDDETADPSIRGKSLRYEVTLKTLKARDLVTVDDEFAKTVAGVDTVEALRQEILTDIHRGKTENARNDVMNDIVRQISERSELDLPHAMIHEEAHHQVHRPQQELAQSGTPWDAYLKMQNKTEEDIAVDLEPQAAMRLRSSLLLRAVADAEKIEVTDEDIDAELERIIGPGSDDDTDEAKEQRERMRSIYNSDYFRNMLSGQLFDKKLTDHLIDMATEGRGHVNNGFVEPEPVIEAESSEITSDGGEEASAETGSDDAIEASGSVVSEEAEAAPASSGKELGPADREGTDWVAGNGENSVPEGFPIKGNASSRIYHPVESPSYDRTIAEVYFASPEAAEAAGYRLPKSLQNAGNAAVEAAANLAAEAAEEAENAD